MRVVVTGASGFLGRAVVDAFAGDSAQLLCVSRHGDPTGLSADLSEVGDWQDAIAGFAPTHVVHLAGAIQGDHATLERANILTTRNLVDALEGIRPWLLSGGSGAVYGNVDAAELPVTEARLPHPLGAYGYHKLAQEREANRYGGPLCLVRFSNLFGPHQSSRFVVGRMVNEACKCITRSDVSRVVEMGDLSPTRDFLDIRDAALAILNLARKGATGTFNVSSGHETPLRHIAELVREFCPGDWRFEERPDRAPNPIARQALSIDAIRKAVGWTPKRTTRRVVREMVAARLSGTAAT